MSEPAETGDVQPRWILLTMAGLALVIGLFVGGAALFLRSLPQPTPPGPADASVPEPHLQNDPVGDRMRLEAQKDGEADNLAWVDRQDGIARIPIARAIDLLVQRGWP